MKKRNGMKLFTLILTLSFLLSATVVNAGKVTLVEGTPVKVRFDPNMKISSGKLEKGIPLLIYLAEDIKVGGITIVEAGAEGKAEVLEVVPASRPSTGGSIKVGFIELTPKGEYSTLDVSGIKLSGTTEAKGKNKKYMIFLLGIGLLLKGGQGEIDTSKTYEAQIKETIIMQSP